MGERIAVCAQSAQGRAGRLAERRANSSGSEIETEDFAPLPLGRGELDPFDADTANRELLPQGYVYSAGYGRFQKPIFFLGKLLRVEERAGFTIVVSSCEYARELAAPPAMLQGRTIFLRLESVRRYLWEKIEEWQWRKQDNAMARALASYDFIADTEAALQRMADNETETMILHEVGEAMAGELLGDRWREMVVSVARTRSEPIARAVRDLLADCLSTLPALLAARQPAGAAFLFRHLRCPAPPAFSAGPGGVRAFSARRRLGPTLACRARRKGALAGDGPGAARARPGRS